MKKLFIISVFILSFNFSFAQNEPIINNYGLSNTAIVDNLQLPEQSTPQQTQSIISNSQTQTKITQFELEQRRQMASPAIGGLRVDNRIKANIYEKADISTDRYLNKPSNSLWQDNTVKKPSLESHNNTRNTVYTQQSDGTYKLKSSNSISTFLIIFIIISIIVLLLIYKLYNKRPLKVALRNRLDKELKVLVDKLPIDGTYEALEKTISNFELTNVFKVQSYATEYNLTTDEVYEVINQYLYDLREQKEKFLK